MMSTKRRRAVITGCLLVSAVGSACAQSAGHSAAAPVQMRVVAATAGTVPGSDPDVLREIEDPSTGDLWLLLRDQSRSGGPGRLVLARQRANIQGTAGHGPARLVSVSERPVIHSGDAVIVEEHTPSVDARLEAIALGPAAKGAHFRARLKIGGRVVRVVATSPGHAVFAPQSEVEP